jgi:probable HAF family extracellular repeat protein
MQSRMILTCMTAMTLFVVMAVPVRLAAQPHYNVVELGELGGTAGSANGINKRLWMTGTDNLTGDATTMATLWVNGGAPQKLGTLSGGPNSAIAWPVKNNNGVIVGISELPDLDPTGESFSCFPFLGDGNPSGRICKGLRWQNNQMTALEPFPGGYSSYATAVNNLGQVVGWAENGVVDPTCVNLGNGISQVLQFRAAIWQPDGTMQELPPLPGDHVSAATAINDLGQVVGISGDCFIAVGNSSAKHAVLWQNGVPMDLGNLGGDAWNTPTQINNHGTVIGFANTAPGLARTFVAFVWTPGEGMKSLGTLPGVCGGNPCNDFRSEALGINEKGVIVGLSRGNPPPNGNAPFLIRAFVWQNGKMTDMNSLSSPSSLYLLFGGDIDPQGRVVGEAVDLNTCDPVTGACNEPGYAATPVPPGTVVSAAAKAAPQIKLSEKAQRQIERQLGFGSELIP